MINFILGAVAGFAVGVVLGIVIMSVLQIGNNKRLDDWTD